ncbi:MAG: DUF58 domain-containing protein [Dokdonella sp.]|uniref:DUF58 domain-containing protein n=1 Tax=Dokdonella sp. TaxID=2291710 RepID=UPI0032661A2D
MTDRAMPFRARLLAIAERALPALTRLRRAEALPIRLDRRRIYVVPSGFGLAFAALLFVMLIGSLNYGNNPALLLTCLLGAAAGASVYFGFACLSGLELAQVRGDEAYAGGPLRIHLRFTRGARARPSLIARSGKTEIAFSIPAETEAAIDLTVGAPERGWQRPGRIRIGTGYPLGLFTLWSWVNPDVPMLVYPTLESPVPALPGGDGARGEHARAGSSEEHSGLREYRVSDAARLIAWKASVRHDNLLVRDTERRSGDVLTLDHAALPGLDGEARIRRLAAWVIAADAEQRSFALLLPDETIGPGLGETHRHRCLRALALLHRADVSRG